MWPQMRWAIRRLKNYRIIFLLLLILFAYSLSKQKPFPISDNSRGILLIAHPDDETMFFGPTILMVISENTCSNHLFLVAESENRTPHYLPNKWKFRRVWLETRNGTKQRRKLVWNPSSRTNHDIETRRTRRWSGQTLGSNTHCEHCRPIKHQNKQFIPNNV